MVHILWTQLEKLNCSLKLCKWRQLSKLCSEFIRIKRSDFSKYLVTGRKKHYLIHILSTSMSNFNVYDCDNKIALNSLASHLNSKFKQFQSSHYTNYSVIILVISSCLITTLDFMLLHCPNNYSIHAIFLSNILYCYRWTAISFILIGKNLSNAMV